MPSQGIDEAFEKQRNFRIEESKVPGETYALLFQKGGQADLYSRLGELYLKQSKPIQANRHFKEALKLDPKSKEASEGAKTAKERINYLGDRIKYFMDKKQKDKNYQHDCSKASILFHLGFPHDAFETLSKADQEFQNNTEIGYLRGTFEKGVAINKMALQAVRDDFERSVAGKQFHKALENLGQLLFLSLGRIPTEPYLQTLKKEFPDEFSKMPIGETIALVAE